MINLTKTQKESFADQFLERYLFNGYASMQKREIDILVFHLISESKDVRGQSNYEIANRLRIPESRVKSLRLNAALKYKQANHKAVLADIVTRITQAMQKPEFSGGAVEITIENPVEQRELAHAIKVAGRNLQYTLNSEVFGIAPIALFELVVQNLENPEKEFKSIVQNHIADSTTQKKIMSNSLTLRQKLNMIGKEVSDSSTLASLLTAACGAL